MTLIQLQYFVAVCKYQNLTKAAAELSVSQPALSVSMKELETECGFPLFERRPNSLRLTGQGSAFLREAEHLLGHYRELRRNAALIAREKTVLRFGVATMGAGAAFARLRKEVYKALPELSFAVTEDSTEHLYHQIDTGELDFALCVSIRLPDENYRYVTLGNSRLLFCVHRENPLALRRPESLTELGDVPLVLLSERYSQTKYLRRLFEGADYTPNVVQHTSQVFTILQHIRENAAAGFLSEDILDAVPEAAGFALREVDLASLTVIWRRDRQTFSAMDRLIRYLRGRRKEQEPEP